MRSCLHNLNPPAYTSLLILLLLLCSYKTFHSEQLECVRKYPDTIKDQLEIYDREICAYFAVDRNKPLQVKKVQYLTFQKCVERIEWQRSLSLETSFQELISKSLQYIFQLF